MEIEHKISKEAFETISEVIDLKLQIHRQLIREELIAGFRLEIERLEKRIEKLERSRKNR